MNLYDIPTHSDSPKIVNAVTEITKGTSAKYEYCPDWQVFKLDRCLASAMVYPCNYGFIPQTKAADGDALDVLIYNNTPVARGTVIECRVIGVLDMEDDGVKDYKILARPTSHVNKLYSIKDIDPLWLRVAQYFFRHYKDLDKKQVNIGSWYDKEKAWSIIKQDTISE